MDNDNFENTVSECINILPASSEEHEDAKTAIRIVVKYLLFDLEATRRERDEFEAKARGGIQ